MYVCLSACVRMCVSIVAFDQGHCCVNLVHISQGIQLRNRQPWLRRRTVPSLHPHLSPPFSPLSSASLLLAAGQLGSEASVAGLRCSLSWAGVGEERSGEREREERRGEKRILSHRRPKREPSKNRKQTRAFMQV